VFETLFKYSSVLGRHRGGPFADLRERFLIHCAEQRMAHATLLRVASDLLLVADRIDLNAEQPFERRHTRPVLAAGHVERHGFELPAGQIPDLIAMQADVRGKPAALDLPKNHFMLARPRPVHRQFPNSAPTIMPHAKTTASQITTATMKSAG